MGFRIIFILISLQLSACGANFTSIYRTYSPDGTNKTTTALVDAKQRAIIATPNNSTDSNRDVFVCAEPSPDALSAISSSFASSIGFGQPSTQVQAALAAAVQEAASQLGVRNATIQLLRDGLYRQCEAYMNGLIDASTYDQISNKYINAMVTLLAIEEITPSKYVASSSNETGGTSANSSTEVNIGINPEDAGTPDEPGDTNDPDTESEDSDGTSSSSATSGAPSVSVNLPDNSSGASEHVALATVQMTQTFLRKDTVDFCLYTLPRLAQVTENVNKELIREFSKSCSEIIASEHKRNLELEKNIQNALSGIPEFPSSEK